MRLTRRINDWLETHWVTPAYAGWVLLGLTLFFLLAASNTLAGWLYVLSGLGLALLAIATLLPPRILQGITIERQTLYPVNAGNTLRLGLTFHNTTTSEKSLLQVQDQIPSELGTCIDTADSKERLGLEQSATIATIPALGTQTWSYGVETRHRGIYHWQSIHLRTAAPLGLFWCRRQRLVKAKAIVYPIVLNLTQCPLIDQVGQEQSQQTHHLQMSHEGVTRSLRPYRWGDPMRLVHWRSSARHNELRIRELEVSTGGQGLVIGLDSAADWHPDDFEQAVIAAASLYTYAERQMPIQLWTAGTGLCQGTQRVLETLAQVQPQEECLHSLPNVPIIWLSQTSDRLSQLSLQSRVIAWSRSETTALQRPLSDCMIQANQPLQPQL
ncbi:MAG: DUF58 domain-containing protein, partial [Cyanobacteria bacterium P01_A01_bin.17]